VSNEQKTHHRICAKPTGMIYAMLIEKKYTQRFVTFSGVVEIFHYNLHFIVENFSLLCYNV